MVPTANDSSSLSSPVAVLKSVILISSYRNPRFPTELKERIKYIFFKYYKNHEILYLLQILKILFPPQLIIVNYALLSNSVQIRGHDH